MNPSKGTRLVRLHRTQRTALPRLLGSLLLVTAAGIAGIGAAPERPAVNSATAAASPVRWARSCPPPPR